MLKLKSAAIALRPFAGSIVHLPDHTIGTVTAVDGCIAQIVHDDRVTGRGPWEYPVGEIIPATLTERAQYLARVRAFRSIPNFVSADIRAA